MKINILTSNFFIETVETHGKDRIIFGGAERYMYELVMLLQSQGHDVIAYQPMVIYREVDGKKVKASVGAIDKMWKGMKVRIIPDCSENSWMYGVNPEVNLAFNEFSIEADLRIYFATYMAYPYALNPSISISHGIYWDYPHFTYQTCDEKTKQEYFKRMLYGHHATSVCVSCDSNTKRVIQAMAPGYEQNIHIVYNFVDTNKFTPADKHWEGVRILFPRRLTILRGCNDFLTAAKKYPQYEYTAVGQASSEEAENHLREWGDRVSNIKFIFREMEGMEEIYQGSDISVVPTRSTEGLSLSLLESLSCGLPVVTTPVGGLGDAVIDGYNAMICDLQQNDLGEYINYLAENEDMRKKLGKRAREVAVECFDIEIWKQKWMNVINRLV